MYKIAVVGDYDSIFGFAALGLDTFAVQTREEAAEKLHQLAQADMELSISQRNLPLS